MKQIYSSSRLRYTPVLAAGAIVLLIYFLFDPLQTSWMPQCVFYRLTGFKCMGCGAQTMIHALIHGDIAGAWKANAFLLCSLPVLAFLVWLEISRTRRPELYRRLHSIPVILATAATLLAWLLLRNILGI